MDVRNHRIADIWYGQTSNLSSGTITPTVICNHYTTGWSGAGSRDWLMGAAGGTANRGSSAHLVIDRDGTAWQIAPFNRRTWHAGPSRYGTLRNLNSHSIGIELVNPGWLKSDGHGGWVDSYGKRRSSDELEAFGGYMLASHGRIGSGTFAWPLYTEAQIDVTRAIIAALIDKYGIRAIVTHEEIDSRGWKTDPGPAFPHDSFVEMLGEDEGPDDEEAGDLPTSETRARPAPDHPHDDRDVDRVGDPRIDVRELLHPVLLEHPDRGVDTRVPVLALHPFVA